MSNFHVGQRVASLYSCTHKESGTSVTKGGIYTIRRIAFAKTITGLCFVEHKPVSVLHPICDEYCWNSAHFRPLIETDISIFQAILANPHKELETV